MVHLIPGYTDPMIRYLLIEKYRGGVAFAPITLTATSIRQALVEVTRRANRRVEMMSLYRQNVETGRLEFVGEWEFHEEGGHTKTAG